MIEKKIEIIKLEGFSGFNTILYKDKNIYIVKKQSSSFHQNVRLRYQYLKHSFFLKQSNDYFKVPKILKACFNNKLNYYEYEYIEGETLIHFIEKNGVFEIKKILDKLIAIIVYFKKRSAIETIDCKLSFKESIKNKIVTISKKIKIDPNSLSKLDNELNNFIDIDTKTLCHGDYSFDNIIIDKNNKIWLIDFLDSFYPHYWLDISKLFQDVDGKWFEIKHNLKLPINKLEYIKIYLIKKLSEIEPFFFENYKLFLSLVFLRILPYTNSKIEKEFIFNKIKYFLK